MIVFVAFDIVFMRAEVWPQNRSMLAKFAQQQPWQPGGETEKQSGKHPGHQRIVAQIAEMRDAAFVDREKANRRRQVHRLAAAPALTHYCFRVEIEAAHPTLPAPHLAQRLDRIDAESEQRIADAGPQGFE